MITNDNIFGNDVFEDIIRIVFEVAEEKKRREQELLAQQAKGTGKKDKKEKKGGKEKKEKKEKKGKKGKDKKSGESTTPADVTTALPLPLPVSEMPEIIEIPANPGEPRWLYVDLLQPIEFQITLASLWEDIEEIFLNDLKQLFFQMRIYRNTVVPYTHDIYTHMTNFIERPDKKQEYLHKFQVAYNDLENDLREDDEFKSEMHCRIMEFKSKLWDISTYRMRESEEERIRLINENWFTLLAIELTNLFIAAMQLELDRSMGTFQFLQDHYISMVTQEPSIDIKYNKIILAPFKYDEKVFLYIADSYKDPSNNIQITKNPFNTFIDSVSMKNALQNANACYSTALTATKNLDKFSSAGDGGKGKKKLNKKTAPIEPAYITEIKNNLARIEQEWQCAIDGEFARVKYRINLLNAKAHMDINELILYGKKMFHEIYGNLDKRYQEELHSINIACEIFHKATEACESIQPRLIIDGAKFFIDKSELLYHDIFKYPHPFDEDAINMDLYFTIPQLSKLADIFMDLAPNGSLPLKTFIYIIQDIVTHESDYGYKKFLPVYWHRLEPREVWETIVDIYGYIEYINWKDFIIYNLELPFPTEKELLDVRQQFRDIDPDKLEYVNKVQFNMVQFWFENDGILIRPTYTKRNIKNLLCKMFDIKVNCINYSALLLSFCKDHDPVVGVAKALGLCIGKYICWNIETGMNYIEILRYQKYLNEQQKKDGICAPESETSSFLEQSMTPNVSEKKFPSVSELNNNNNMEKEQQHFENISERAESFLFDGESLDEGEESPLYKPSPALCYILPFHIILIIMTAALPWHTRVKCVQDKSLKEHLEVIYESVRNEEFQVVFAHEFLNSDAFKEYLMRNYKFTVRSPANIVQLKVEKCTCNQNNTHTSIIFE